MSNNKNRAVGMACALSSAVLFGLMPLLAKTAYACGLNAVTVSFGRFLFGAAVAGLVILISPHKSFHLPKAKIKGILLLSFLYAITPVLLYLSYEHIATGTAMTLHFTYPIVVAVLSAVFFHRRFTLRQALCAALCVGGIALLHPFEAGSLFGMLCALFSGWIYSVYVVLLEKVDLKEQEPITVTFWISVFAALEIGLYALIFRQLVFSFTPGAVLSQAALGVFATVFALALFQKSVFLCGGFTASLLSSAEPLTSVILGVLVFHEDLTILTALGILVVITSVVLLVLGGREKN